MTAREGREATKVNSKYACPPSVFIYEELLERGWTVKELASRMGGTTPEEIGIDQLTIEMTLACDYQKGCIMAEETAKKLGRAFDVNEQFFINLDKGWRESKQRATDLPHIVPIIGESA